MQIIILMGGIMFCTYQMYMVILEMESDKSSTKYFKKLLELYSI